MFQECLVLFDWGVRPPRMFRVFHSYARVVSTERVSDLSTRLGKGKKFYSATHGKWNLWTAGWLHWWPLQVVFTEKVQPYKELRNRVFTDRLFERQFKIGYCSQEIKDAYDKLLENCCRLCKVPPFRNFGLLNEHMRKVHERFYCELCIAHLRVSQTSTATFIKKDICQVI